MNFSLRSSHKGFSIILALGSIGVLMVIVVGIIQIFLTEMKLSRYQYDYIIASEQGEGVFEYAMLKVANHKNGFEDEMSKDDLDEVLFSGSTDRTRSNSVNYKIHAQTNSLTQTILGGEYLIFPLFTGDDLPIISGKPSKDPSYSKKSIVAENLHMGVSSHPEDLSWNIVAMSGSLNTSISGTGGIDGFEIGTTRLRSVECFDDRGQNVPLTNGECPSGGDALQYFYDSTGSVDDFMKIYSNGTNTTQVKDPFFLVFNKGTNPITITLTSDPAKPFSLPTLDVIGEARKGNAVQTIRFHSDKSKYYDAIKYAIYDTN